MRPVSRPRPRARSHAFGARHARRNLHHVSVCSPCSSRCRLILTLFAGQRGPRGGPTPAIRTWKARLESTACPKDHCVDPTSCADRASRPRLPAAQPQPRLRARGVGVTSRERGRSIWLFCTWTVCLLRGLELTFPVRFHVSRSICVHWGVLHTCCAGTMDTFRKEPSEETAGRGGQERGLGPGRHRQGWGSPCEAHHRVTQLVPGLRVHGARGQTRPSLPAVLRQHWFDGIKTSASVRHPSGLVASCV